jgi:hypothetical protein
VLLNQGGIPSGLAPYGFGTPGCAGALGISGNGPAKVSQPLFGLTCTNAPPDASGLCLITDVLDLFGSDPFGLGVKLHVDLASAATILSLPFSTDASGSGFARAPIPNIPALIGKVFYAQGVFAEKPSAACSASASHLVSTAGLAFFVQA